MKKTENINSLCEIHFGLYAKPEQSGDIVYLQARHFNEHGSLISKPDDFINIDEKTKSHLLYSGDVLFVGKGNRLFSWCYRLNEPAVASSIFFVLRPNTDIIYPEYLAAILNTPQTISAFKQIGGGTNILSIRKSELGAFEIPLPSLKRQKLIAEINHLHLREIELNQKINYQKEKLFSAAISKTIIYD